jgi:hypothetical protein
VSEYVKRNEAKIDWEKEIKVYMERELLKD